MKDFQSNVPLSREEQLLQGVKTKTTRGATEPPPKRIDSPSRKTSSDTAMGDGNAHPLTGEAQALPIVAGITPTPNRFQAINDQLDNLMDSNASSLIDMGPQLEKRPTPKRGRQKSLTDLWTPTRGKQSAEVQQSNTGNDPVENADTADKVDNKEGNDNEDNLEENSDGEPIDSPATIKDISGSPSRPSVVPEEDLTDANDTAKNSSEVPPKDMQGSTEDNTDPLAKDTAEGVTGPPPEVTPTKVSDTDQNNTGNKTGNESSQESGPDSLKPPETNLVVNPPATDTVALDVSPKILRTPRRSTLSTKNEDLTDESFIEGMSEKLKEIHLKADLIKSPRQKTILIENEYCH